MPTKPVSEILNRELDPERADILEEYADKIEETINFGTHILDWMNKATEGGSGSEFIPPYLMFQRALEILDSISILVKTSSIDPCFGLLRILLEVVLSLEYILQADSKEKGRSFVLVCSLHKDINSQRRYDKETQQGKQFLSNIRRDRILSGFEVPHQQDGGKVATEKEQDLKTDPNYSELETEYQRLRTTYKSGKKRKNKWNPPWYSLLDGPQNIQQLAAKVDLSGMYEVFYRHWSAYGHGIDMLESKIVSVHEGGANIIQLRSPAKAEHVTNISMGLALLMYMTFVEKYVKEKQPSLREWYIQEIKEFYDIIRSQTT